MGPWLCYGSVPAADCPIFRYLYCCGSRYADRNRDPTPYLNPYGIANIGSNE